MATAAVVTERRDTPIQGHGTPVQGSRDLVGLTPVQVKWVKALDRAVAEGLKVIVSDEKTHRFVVTGSGSHQFFYIVTGDEHGTHYHCECADLFPLTYGAKATRVCKHMALVASLPGETEKRNQYNAAVALRKAEESYLQRMESLNRDSQTMDPDTGEITSLVPETRINRVLLDGGEELELEVRYPALTTKSHKVGEVIITRGPVSKDPLQEAFE